MERNILGDGIDAVEFRDREAIFKGTDYLLECGHKNILFLRESLKSTTRDERTRGFLLALEEHGINTNDANISDINIESGADNCILEIQKAMRRYMPTAIMAGGNRITLYLMKTMRIEELNVLKRYRLLDLVMRMVGVNVSTIDDFKERC